MSTLDSYQLIIFDWDGTLMDSTGRIVSAMQTSAKQAQLSVPSEKEVKSIIGLSMQAVMQTLFADASKSKVEEFIEIYRYQYIEGDDTPTPLFEGAQEQLQWLRDQGKQLAVATGKARHGLDRVLKEVDLLNFFDFTICADEANSKPHPEMVHRLLERADAHYQRAIVVGDSVHDLRMAQNAKVDSIGVTSGANDAAELRSHEPLAILDTVSDIKSWFELRSPVTENS